MARGLPWGWACRRQNMKWGADKLFSVPHSILLRCSQGPYFSSTSVSVIKTPWSPATPCHIINLEERVFIWLTIPGYTLSLQGSQDRSAKQPVTSHPLPRAERINTHSDSYTRASVPLKTQHTKKVIPFSVSSPWQVLSTFKEGLPNLINSTKKNPSQAVPM